MPAIDLAALATAATAVLAGVFALAFVFGVVAQRSNFCTMGGIADAVNFGDRTRLRRWVEMTKSIFQM